MKIRICAHISCCAINPNHQRPIAASRVTNNPLPIDALDIQEFKELKNPLVPKKVELEEQIAVLEKSKTNRLEPLRNWILEANQA